MPQDRLAAETDRLSRLYGGDTAAVERQMVSDWVAKSLFTNERAIRQFATQHPQAAKQIMSFLDDVAVKLRDKGGMQAIAGELEEAGRKWGRVQDKADISYHNDIDDKSSIGKLMLEGDLSSSGEYLFGAHLNNESHGRTTRKIDYRKVFFSKYPYLKGKVFVHHSIEQQVLRIFPELFSIDEINTIEWLRGIPNDKNCELHLSMIRQEWNRFYDEIAEGLTVLSRDSFIKKADEIDDLYGNQFNPPIKSRRDINE